MDTITDAPAAGIRQRLKAQKEARGGRLTTKLPISGYEVSYPAFMTHAQVMNATKMAGKNRANVGPVLVAQVCLFEGERLTVDEITGELLHNIDAVHLINLVLGEGDGDGKAGDEDGSGN